MNDHHQFSAVQMLARSYDGESAVARLGGAVNVSGGGGYEFGYSSAMGGAAGRCPGSGRSAADVLKPGTAGGGDGPPPRSSRGGLFSFDLCIGQVSSINSA